MNCKLKTAHLSILLIALLFILLSTGRGKAVEAPSVDSQRVRQLDRLGGLVTASLPRPDGTVLAAEGSALVRLDPSANPARVLGRADLGHGSILALAETPSHPLALTEEGLVVLAGAGLPAPVSFTPGGGQVMAAAGERVVIAAREAGLRVLRIDPAGVAAPLSMLPLPGGALDVALAPGGASAFVAAGPSGVHLVDLSDPAAPRLLQTLDAVTPADAVAPAGSLLVVGSRGRVLLLDPASSGQPILGLYAPLRDGRRMVIDQDFAYIADAADGLKIVWLAAPDRPLQVYGEADRPAADLWIDGTIAYVVGAGGLRILDVGNRYRPLEMAHLPFDVPSGKSANPQAVAVAGGRAFIALGDDGLAIVDVSNWALPRLTGFVALDGPARAVLYRDGYLYVACGEAGLAVIDARRPGGETLVETFPLPGVALDLARRGDALYVAAQEAGLIALDILRPATPVIKGLLPPDAGRSVLSVFISGKRAYLSQGNAFLVADIAFPNRLGRLARVDAPAEHVVANDIYLYALSGSRIAVYDARATAEPVYQRTYSGLSHIGRIAVRGDSAFVTGAGPDAVVLSLLAPDYPYELDSVGQTGGAYSVSATSGRVYLAAGFGGLLAYDVSEGGALIPRSRYNTLPEAAHLATDGSRLLAGGRMGWSMIGGSASSDLPVRDLALDGDTLAVAAGDAGLALYRLADTQEPALLARRSTPGPALGVALDDRFVYAAGPGGLSIYDRRYLASVRHVTTPAPAMDVALHAGLAYLPLDDGSLAVVEVGDPFGGLQRSSSVEMSYPADLLLAPDGRTVYALAATIFNRLGTDSRGRLYVDQTGALPEVAGQGAFFQEGVLAALVPGQVFRLIDTSRLETQTSITSTMDTSAEDIVLNWPVGYAAYGEEGLGLIDMRSRVAGPVFYPETVHALYRQGDRLFALGEALSVWDVSQPGQPVLLATLPVAGLGRHIDPACGDAGCSPSQADLLLSLESGLAIAHWDGAALTETANLFTAGAVDRAARLGERGYLALHSGGLLVVDLSNPAEPVDLFTYTSPSGRFVSDLLPLDDIRLLAGWESGIDILDVDAAAGAPRLLTMVPSSGSQALNVTLSPDGSRAALALGDEGVALFSLADPRRPQVMGHADTPGAGLAVALDASTLYVADGLCGLRVFDASDPASLSETGYWRGGYASDLATRLDESGQPVLSLAGANQVVTLRYDPSLPPVPPPLPQSPGPANGQGDASLSPALKWGPPADPCDPLAYDVFFGQDDNPPLLGQVSGTPLLEVPDLTPLRSYSWRVETTDRQGDRVAGPLWRFTTVTTEFANTTPPAPPTFLAWAEEHPLVTIGASGLMLAALAFFALRWLRPQKRAIPAIVPEWYSTHEDEEEKDS